MLVLYNQSDLAADLALELISGVMGSHMISHASFHPHLTLIALKNSVVIVRSHELKSYFVFLCNLLLTLPLLLPFWLLNLFCLRLIASERKYQHLYQQ